MTTKVNEIMTLDACIVAPEETIGQAATLMREKDVGSVAVGSDDRLVGMLTDRDIAVRAVAMNKGPETPVREVMSGAVKYCFDNDDIEDVANNMGNVQVRRLPVVDRDKRLVGFVSLGNIGNAGSDQARTSILKGVATPH